MSVGLLLSISGKVLEMVRSLREERGEEDGSVSDLSSEAGSRFAKENGSKIGYDLLDIEGFLPNP